MSELEDAIRDGGKVILGGNANTAKNGGGIPRVETHRGGCTASLV